jgi:hypothetical protein
LFKTDDAHVNIGALLVAIEDINKNPEILPDYKLTYIYNNTCGDEIKGIKSQ